MNYYKILTESGVDVSMSAFLPLDEATQAQVTDSQLTSMMKFITDKYNSIDFSEIEKSAGDITKFKYHDTLKENRDILYDVYKVSNAKSYLEVISAFDTVDNHLMRRRAEYSTLYRSGNGVIQLVYTSLVAAMIYSIGTLISNTIRFITVENDTDCEVLFDEIPGTIKHIHIRNLVNTANDIQKFDQLVMELSKAGTKQKMQESVVVGAGVTAIIAIGAIVIIIPRIFTLIREIIYSIYYTRVKVSDMLGLQSDLIRTNIESLEHGRGNKKVIARQKKIADKLEKWKNRISLKMDATNTLTKKQINDENRKMKLDKDSPILTDTDATVGVLI